LLVNGKPDTHIFASDRGLHYGDGLFETIAITGGEPCLWKQHMARLKLGGRRLGINVPESNLLYSEILHEIGVNTRGVVKIILTRGEGTRGYRPATSSAATRVINFSSWPNYPDAASRDGVVARICNTRMGSNSTLAGMKHLNRLEQVMARMEWQDHDIAEGLMLDGAGQVIEGTMSNLFMVKDGELLTPDLTNSGVAGVMRGLVIEIARDLNIPVKITDIRLPAMLQADGLFLTNSLIGVWPIRKIAEQSFKLNAIDSNLLEITLSKGLCCVN